MLGRESSASTLSRSRKAEPALPPGFCHIPQIYCWTPLQRPIWNKTNPCKKLLVCIFFSSMTCCILAVFLHFEIKTTTSLWKLSLSISHSFPGTFSPPILSLSFICFYLNSSPWQKVSTTFSKPHCMKQQAGKTVFKSEDPTSEQRKVDWPDNWRWLANWLSVLQYLPVN